MADSFLSEYSSDETLSHLASYFDARHEEILLAWRLAVESDSRLTTVSHLNREEFEDNITDSLRLLSQRLRSGQAFHQEGSADHSPQVDWADREESKHAHAHGFHRWQEGYDVRELMLEWGHLHLCLIHVVNNFESKNHYADRDKMHWARLTVGQLINGGFSQSVAEYHRLQQAEAKEIVNSLSQALRQLKDYEQQRGQLLRESIHDLRGNLSSVQAVTSVLDAVAGARDDVDLQNSVFGLLQRGTSNLNEMLTELLDLARLEAGQEKGRIQTINIGEILNKLCEANQLLAQNKKLYLQSSGPENLTVEGDGLKIQRIAQNLLHNAIKYTDNGGVTVQWEEAEPNQWRLIVQDTGPGIALMSAKPAIIEELVQSESSHTNESESSNPEFPLVSGVGEGVGVVIVKRLCSLLDAEIEVDTAQNTGTTFRVTFPRSYSKPQRTSVQ